MNQDEMNQNIEDISASGLGTSFLLHLMNDITETARRKGMLYGFILGVSITTVVQILILHL